jgi:hypothetical protein
MDPVRPDVPSLLDPPPAMHRLCILGCCISSSGLYPDLCHNPKVRVTLAECELAVSRGDVDGALQRLKRVPPASPHFARARTALAGIHLKARRDPAAYIQCYLDLVVSQGRRDGPAGAGKWMVSVFCHATRGGLYARCRWPDGSCTWSCL